MKRVDRYRSALGLHFAAHAVMVGEPGLLFDGVTVDVEGRSGFVS